MIDNNNKPSYKINYSTAEAKDGENIMNLISSDSYSESRTDLKPALIGNKVH